MKQLLNLPGRPPQGGAGPFDTRKEAFTNYPESVTLRRVNRIVGSRIDITCMFGQDVVTFRFFAANRGMAENVAEVFRCNAGQSLLDLGMLLVADSE